MLKQIARLYSDEINLGKNERFIPLTLESRILRHKIDVDAVDILELRDYMRGFKDFNILEMDVAIVQMYFFEKFVEKLKGPYLDSAELLSQSASFKDSEYYKVQNNGRSFHVREALDAPQYHIMGAMELQKGDKKRVIIVDPRGSEKLNRGASDRQFVGATYLVNSVDEIRVIRTYPINLFIDALLRERRYSKVDSNGGILAYLEENQGVYCLVYSVNRHEIRNLAHQALTFKETL